MCQYDVAAFNVMEIPIKVSIIVFLQKYFLPPSIFCQRGPPALRVAAVLEPVQAAAG